MRTLTVTTDDDPMMTKSDEVELVKKNTYTKQFIINALNTGISAYLSAVSKPLGTVASLMGFDVSKLGDTQTGNKLEYQASADWVREFTQVYGPYNFWSNGSCVEYATLASQFSGFYYDKTARRSLAYPARTTYATQYSSKYFDHNWRKEQAYRNYISKISWNTLGDIKFYYGNTLKITLKENF